MRRSGATPFQRISLVYRSMTPEFLSDRWLSLRCWLLRTVLPSAGSLLIVLAILTAANPDERTLNHTSAMVGFAALYFCLFRGGHMLMIRSLHFEMLRKHDEAYRDKLAAISDGQLRRRNLGFTLARLKRDILVEARAAEEDRKHKLTGRNL